MPTVGGVGSEFRGNGFVGGRLREDGGGGGLEWASRRTGRATDVAGDLLEPMDIYPPRYRVREFPSEKQLAAMGNMLK